MTALKKYQALAKKLDERLSESRTHLEQLQGKAKNLHTGLLVAQHKHQEGEISVQELLRSRKNVDSVLNEISQVESIIEQASAMHREQLKSLLDSLKLGLENQISEMRVRIQGKTENLMRLRAETLLAVKELHGETVGVNNLYDEVQAIFNSHGAKLNVWRESPSLNLTSQVAGVDKNLVAVEHEIREAYGTGNVTFFVLWYQMSGGEIVDNETARKNLMKAGVIRG